MLNNKDNFNLILDSDNDPATKQGDKLDIKPDVTSDDLAPDPPVIVSSAEILPEVLTPYSPVDKSSVEVIFHIETPITPVVVNNIDHHVSLLGEFNANYKVYSESIFVDNSDSSDVLGRFYSNNIRLFRKYLQPEIFYHNYYYFYDNDNFYFKNSKNYEIILEDLKYLQHNTLFYYKDYVEFLKNKHINNCDLTYNKIDKASNYNIFFYYYNFMEIIEYNCMVNIENKYTDHNNLSFKDNTHVSAYNNDRVISDRDAKIELILSDYLGEVRILVVDAISNVSFALYNIFRINHLYNLDYVLKGYYNDNNILPFDNTKDKWGDKKKTSCNLVSSFSLLTWIDSYDYRFVLALSEVDMSRLALSLLILFNNDELEFDITFLAIKEFVSLRKIIYDLIFLASFIINNINNNDKISNNLINDNTLFTFINKEKSHLDNASMDFNEWGLMHERRITLDNNNYPSFYFYYSDFYNRKDNEHKDLLTSLSSPTEYHYLSRELTIEVELEEEYLVVDNNFISNIVDDIILNVINSFNNDNDLSDLNVSNLSEDKEYGGNKVEILSLPVTCSEPLLPVPPEPPPQSVIKNHN